MSAAVAVAAAAGNEQTITVAVAADVGKGDSKETFKAKAYHWEKALYFGVPARPTRFEWSTPADEFADDVDSDEGEYLPGPGQPEDAIAQEGDDEPPDSITDDGAAATENPIGVVADDDDDDDDDLGRDNGLGDDELVDDGDEDGVIIQLGVAEVNKYAVTKGQKFKGETPEDIKQLLSGYENKQALGLSASAEEKKKKYESKQKFPCPKCDKIWNWPWELRRHLMTHFKEKERQETSMYKCDECGKGFQWKRDLAQHKRLHTGEKLLVCSVCEKKFVTRQALLHHVVVHTGEKPFQCAVCGNRCTQPANLRTHMKRKHGQDCMKGNKCPHCEEPFQSVIAVHQHILEDHQNIVAEDREQQALQKLHVENEKAEREEAKTERRKLREEKLANIPIQDRKISSKLKAWEIDYEFHLGDGLVRGVDWDRTPSNGELSCDQCDRKFGWRYEVMFHGLCHLTDEEGQAKNKVCPECDTAFKVPIGLKHHLLLHTGELPFLCLHCWRSFSSHIDLKLHIRKEHLVHLSADAAAAAASSEEEEEEGGDAESGDDESKAAEAASAKPKVEKRAKAEAGKKTPAKRLKLEAATAAAAAAQQDAGVTHVLVHAGDGGSGAEAQQMVVAGPGGEQQTIILGGDAQALVNAQGNQEMIVVIQGEDFDQTQGLIVVDPSQVQHLQGGGIPVMVGPGGEQMIMSDLSGAATATDAGGTRYINLQDLQQITTSDGQTAFVMATGPGQADGGGHQQFVVVSDGDAGEGAAVVVSEAAIVHQQQHHVVTGDSKPIIVRQLSAADGDDTKEGHIIHQMIDGQQLILADPVSAAAAAQQQAEAAAAQQQAEAAAEEEEAPQVESEAADEAVEAEPADAEPPPEADPAAAADAAEQAAASEAAQ